LDEKLPISHLGPLTLRADTLCISLGVTVVLLIMAFIVGRRLKLVPGGFQSILEMLVEFFEKNVQENLGSHNSAGYFYFFTSLFLFLLVSNIAGLVPKLTSPTADVSITAAFAIITITLVQISNIRVHGFFGWLKHFFKPFAWYFPFNVLELLTRPLTLALRLYGNIFAGEVMLKKMNEALPPLAPIIWLAFSIFIGVLQAYIFTALSMAYVGLAMEE